MLKKYVSKTGTKEHYHSRTDKWGAAFTTKTVLWLAVQLIGRMETLHRTGNVHGDISPNNFVMGWQKGFEGTETYQEIDKSGNVSTKTELPPKIDTVTMFDFTRARKFQFFKGEWAEEVESQREDLYSDPQEKPTCEASRKLQYPKKMKRALTSHHCIVLLLRTEAQTSVQATTWKRSALCYCGF